MITNDIRKNLGIAGYSIFTGKLNSLKPSLLDGQLTEVQFTGRGALLVANDEIPQAQDDTNQVLTTSPRYLANGAYSPGKLVADFGATVTKNAKASFGIVTGIIGKNRNAAIRWLQLHDTATTPTTATGAVPLVSIEVGIGAQVILGADFFSQAGLKFTTGIAYAWSTVSGTYTAGTASEHDTQVFGV